MSNVLTGTVRIDIGNAAASFAQVATYSNKAQESLKRLSPVANQSTLAMTNLGRVVQDAPFGFLGIANNLNPLLESFQRLKASTGSTKGALKELGKSLTGAGGLGLALSLASTALILFGDKLFGVGKAAKETKSAAEELAEATKSIFKDAGKEATQVLSLIAVLKSETETRERKLLAIKELQSIQPSVFNNLKLEGNAVAGLDAAYQSYITNLKVVIALKIKQAQLEQLITKQLELEGATATKSIRDFNDGLLKAKKLQEAKAKGGGSVAADFVEALAGKKEERQKQLDRLKADVKGLFDEIQELSQGVKLTPENAKKIKAFIPKEVELEAAGNQPFLFLLNLKNIKFALLGGDLKTFQEQVTENINKELEKLVIAPRFNFSPEVIANQANQAAMAAAAQKLTDTFASSIGTGMGDALAAVGEGIGNVLSGESFGDEIFQVFGTLIQNLGKALIQFAVIDKIIKQILANPLTIGPGIALAAGIAAIAVGALIKNIAGARALGGPVSGGQTYLVGEQGPELFTPNTGGQITSNNALRAGGYAGSGMNMNLSGAFEVRGDDLVLVLARANQSQRRLTGR